MTITVENSLKPSKDKSPSTESQLELFDGSLSENDLLWRAHAELKDSADRTRRRLFRELKELREQYVEVNAKVLRLTAKDKALEALEEMEPKIEAYK